MTVSFRHTIRMVCKKHTVSLNMPHQVLYGGCRECFTRPAFFNQGSDTAEARICQSEQKARGGLTNPPPLAVIQEHRQELTDFLIEFY